MVFARHILKTLFSPESPLQHNFDFKNGKRRQIAPQQLIYLPFIPATPFLHTLQFPKRRGKTTNPEKYLFLRKMFGNISLKIFAGIFLLLAVCSTGNFAQLLGAVVGSVCLTHHFQPSLTIVIWFCYYHIIMIIVIIIIIVISHQSYGNHRFASQILSTCLKLSQWYPVLHVKDNNHTVNYLNSLDFTIFLHQDSTFRISSHLELTQDHVLRARMLWFFNHRHKFRKV